jgi:hypothetical protein
LTGRKKTRHEHNALWDLGEEYLPEWFAIEEKLIIRALLVLPTLPLPSLLLTKYSAQQTPSVKDLIMRTGRINLSIISGQWLLPS